MAVVKGMALTARQQAIWDLRSSGKSRDEVARVLGISVNVVSKTYTVIRKKLGICAERKTPGLEEKKPEKAARVLDVLSSPEVEAGILTFKEACKQAGLPARVAEATIRRMLVKFQKPIQVARDIKTSELVRMLNERIGMALHFMDEQVMSEASFRDLALGTSAMIEKRQLLRGEPTQIVSDHERAKLHELLPALVQEAKRRGLTVDGQVTEKTVEPL